MGLWAQGVRVSPSTGPPEPVSGERIIEPLLEDPFPDYDTDMKRMFQAGLNGRVPVPLEKRFLIHPSPWRKRSSASEGDRREEIVEV